MFLGAGGGVIAFEREMHYAVWATGSLCVASMLLFGVRLGVGGGACFGGAGALGVGGGGTVVTE